MLAAVFVAAVVLVLGTLAWWLSRPRVEDPAITATALAESWSTSGLVGVDFATDPPPPSPDELEALTAALGDEPPRVSVTAVEAVADDPLAMTARLAVEWRLPGDRTWPVATTASLVRAPESTTWAVAWDPGLVHPDLAAGDHLELTRTPAERGRVLDAAGEVLVGPERVTRIGLHPARIEDLGDVVDTLVDTLDEELDLRLDGDEVRAAVEAADPEQFVPVVVLRNADYERVEPVLYPLPGTTFRDDVLHLGPERDFARFTLGSVGPVTAEQLEEHPDRWVEGDLVGHSGLQEARDRRLSGTPGWSVVAVPDEGDERDGDDGEDEATVLHEVTPAAGRDVRVTLDRRVQQVAEDVLEDTDTPAAMAVVRPSDGAVLALANSPDATFDIARTGKLPPGSVFKVVTAAALLQDGLGVDDPVSCPNGVEVGDRTIHNAGSLALGVTTFAQGFANSCNTVFVAESADLPDDALAAAATQFGIGSSVAWPLGMPAFAGDVPVTTDAFDHALASFGQGRTLVNPLDLAMVMATVADGEQVLPRLVVDRSGAPVRDGDGGGVDALPDEVVGDLRDLTRLVVTDGSGTAVQDVVGDPVHGKTGTADVTDADGRDGQHAWFAGYRGDLAFALVVTEADGGSGGGTAAPLVADFLTMLGPGW